ncbi:hypothetical protein H6G06_11355 [Anabaena sphaerica FACHB-251]|uniref:Uncharacterized protein n=1 Tax=Anabaena sphaerica FACHB-251 TaxID=2692883 RepID=A0A926WGI7_9NOST|nr:hypothetical protein [Anabaena sphaerica]MBD2294072.1 hypothetical protein [Anabaena sphaerica FACHB-251]
MFGFIKNLIGGIFGFITGLFGKKDSYYLELKEETTQTTPVEAKPATAPTPKAEPVKATKAEPAQPAKAAPAQPAKAAPVQPAVATETTFAPKYLVPSSSGIRRRPGANMSSYLDMARQAKVPG